jgi:hypothetical protein
MGALSLVGCPMEDDDNSGGGPDIDPKLVGTWQYSWPPYDIYPGGYEEYKIVPDGEDYILTYGTNYGEGYSIQFAGKVAYTYRFTDEVGVIIIEYTAGHKQVWNDYSNYPDYVPLDPQPEGNFYGIYYHHLNSTGTQVTFANTSDQEQNMGPTEEKTLDEAIERFSIYNMNQLIDLSTGNPVSKVTAK